MSGPTPAAAPIEGGTRAAARDTLARRVLSASILAPAALFATYLGGAVFAALVAFALILMIFEWTRMIDGAEFGAAFWRLAVAAGIATTLASAGLYPYAHLAAAAGAVAAFVAGRRTRRGLWLAFAAPYLIAPSVALIWLRNDVENGRSLALMIFAIVWIADSFAYFAGRLIRGPKLSPAVSPAKTWAGAIAGVAGGALAGALAAKLLFDGAAVWSLAAIGGGLGLASIVGDMAESAFKRVFGIKDMSGFIPGHGGVLDRLDGMIFATAAVTAALYVNILAAGV